MHICTHNILTTQHTDHTTYLPTHPPPLTHTHTHTHVHKHTHTHTHTYTHTLTHTQKVFDESALSQRCKEEMYKCYPDAKRAHLKSGGNFPYLSRSSEVNLMLQV